MPQSLGTPPGGHSQLCRYVYFRASLRTGELTFGAVRPSDPALWDVQVEPGSESSHSMSVVCQRKSATTAKRLQPALQHTNQHDRHETTQQPCRAVPAETMAEIVCAHCARKHTCTLLPRQQAPPLPSNPFPLTLYPPTPCDPFIQNHP